MSFNNDGFNPNSTGGRNEGFRDDRGGVESYGHGPGSGAFDSANTGVGGYGDQNQQRSSDDQTFRKADDFDSSPQTQFGQSQNQGSDRRAFGNDRSAEKPGFSGSDSTYNTTSTGGAFGQRDDFDDSTRIPGTQSSGTGTGDRLGSTTDDVRDRDQFGSQTGQRHEQFGSQTGQRHDQFGGESERERQGGKPTFGDKMRGNAEKLAGSVTGRHDLKERGQERKTGEF